MLGYLDEGLKATAFIQEHHYADRHFLDDFSSCYARSFRAPAPFCCRLHFFRSLDAVGLEQLLLRSYSRDQAERTEAEGLLREYYLGFVVRRPLPGARFGRTVLKTYPADGRRLYGVVRPYRVNLAGLRIEVEGLAYQQQDRGAAVCASTALWSALQRMAHIQGHRSPTPSAITKAAGSPYAASMGLTDDQMARALSALGYGADAFAPEDNRALFRAKLAAYLEGNLPVVLLLAQRVTTDGGHRTLGHAVTVTGFSEPEEVGIVPSPPPFNPGLRMRAALLDVLYVHDDNLGSHAHYELRDSDEADEQGLKKLELWRGSPHREVSWWMPDRWTVTGANVPRPAKLRLGIEDIYLDMVQLDDILRNEVLKEKNLHYQCRFASGVGYKRRLVDGTLEPAWAGGDAATLRRFLGAASLPRHIAVVGVHDGDDHLLDLFLDVTEIEPVAGFPPIIGLVVFFVIELRSRAVQVAGVRINPDGAWMQVARNLLDPVDGFLRNATHLIHDRDSLFTEAWTTLLNSSGVKCVPILTRRSRNPTG
ncbi:hypothetical protein ACFL5O_08955, partial [Myxococcota bacterium]